MFVPIVQVVTFTPTAAYKASPQETIKPALDVLMKQPGQLKTCHGVELQRPDTHAYLFIVWDKLESHKALMDDEATHKQLLSHLAASMEGKPLVIYDVCPHVTPIPSFEAPVVELAYIKIKEGKDIDELRSTLTTLHAIVIPGLQYVTRGSVMDRPATDIVVIGGWDSQEIFLALFADKSHPAAKLVLTLFELADLMVTHVKVLHP